MSRGDWTEGRILIQSKGHFNSTPPFGKLQVNKMTIGNFLGVDEEKMEPGLYQHRPGVL